MTAPAGLAPADLARAALAAIGEHVVPLTEAGVEAGNKVFGAAMIRKADGAVALAETNAETENPLWHGEIHALKRFYERLDRPRVEDLVFVSTHEPCPMCLAAITWAGFDRIVYLFTYEDSRDAFSIPHDLRIMDEVFGLPDGGYRRSNAFWRAASILELAATAEPDEAAELLAEVERLRTDYARLSERYQARKGDSAIPLP